jgi:hypothetical protein
MKPRPYVQIQAAAVLVVSVIALAVLGKEVTLAVAITFMVATVIWGHFAARYYWLLSKSGLTRSGHRRERDAVMLGCLVVGLILPSALAWCGVCIGDLELFKPPLKGGEAILITLSVVMIPLSILVSSSVDWYLIRPFREGIHDEPACQDSAQGSGQAMDYARYWVLHRMVSEFLAYAGIVGVIALSGTVAGEATHSESGKNIFNLIGLLGVLCWSLVELGKLKAALDFVRYPTCGLASWVRGRSEEGEELSGFVLDVSVNPGVQLIGEPRGHPAPDISDPDNSIPLKHRRTIKPITPPVKVCAGGKCEFWIPDCEVGLRQLAERGNAA